MRSDVPETKLTAIQPALQAAYGRPRWQPNYASGLEELVSCILSQSTTDANRDPRFRQLARVLSDLAGGG